MSDGKNGFEKTKHNFPYKWTLKDAVFTKDKGKVFSCFACGGGSTMGYKLAGFDVLGCNEIDPKMIEAYKANHNPKYAYLEPIQTFKLRTDLPDELYNLDILDGSPPCSSFSTAGNRDDDWGKEKKFREGQAEQILDTLFFDFIDLAKKLQPKVVIAENVEGLLIGEAKNYVRQIYREFDLAGYYVQHWLLNAADMGVPQRRKRVFFIAMRKDLAEPFMKQVDLFTVAPELILEFYEPQINFGEFYQPNIDDRPASKGKMFEYWQNRQRGDKLFSDSIFRNEGVKRCFTNMYIYADDVSPTYTSNSDVIYLFDEYRKPNKFESCCIGSYPQDYNFKGVQYNYLIGMSVPPVMTAQIAKQVYEQWLSKI
jgi:DNA (cytosine-5)-methyltransferase 1